MDVIVCARDCDDGFVGVGVDQDANPVKKSFQDVDQLLLVRWMADGDGFDVIIHMIYLAFYVFNCACSLYFCESFVYDTYLSTKLLQFVRISAILSPYRQLGEF